MKKAGVKKTLKQRRLGLAAGLLLRSRRPKMTPRQLHQHDFKSSTQRIGIRFTERIRGFFRSRWLTFK